MTAEWAIEKTVKLDGGYTVRMTAGPAGMLVEWDPLPEPHSLSKRQIKQYKKARNALALELQERMGSPLLVIDI